ncbi:MAG: Fe(2+) transporter permease subunit FeoB [Pseudomonadales bacterium]
MSQFRIALIGNPNSGKTTLFNALTGSHQKVGNWPGVTVEKKSGFFSHADHDFELIDLPGTYSLHISYEDDSLDQQIAQKFILEGGVDLIVNIVDATSLERGLYLTTQLMDAEVPIVIALNMMDVADKQGIHIDPYALSDSIGCPVVPLIASRGEGSGTLVDLVHSQLGKQQKITHAPVLSADLASSLAAIKDVVEGDITVDRFTATALLERDDRILETLTEEKRVAVLNILDGLQSRLDTSTSDELIAARYRWISTVTKDAVSHNKITRATLTENLDRIFLNRIMAFPLFLMVMYTMFMFTINFGGAFIDFFDIAAGAIFVELPRTVFTSLGLPAWLVAVLTDGLGGGIKLVASFIPVIGTLFLFQTFLEDSGYMARVAFILDRVMRVIGLPGKSFVPLVVGFGCNVPAVMSARTMDSQQDRLLVAIMAPFMSCGARLTVYTLFAAAFFPSNGQNVVFALYIIGILLAVGSGLLVRRQLMNKMASSFVMELPNYHIPTVKGLIIHTWHKLKGFILRAGKAIVLVVIVLNVVNSLGTDGSFGNSNTENSALSAIGKSITPVFSPMGIKEENWPATVGIFSGIFAKEVVVGTLDALYGSMIRDEQGIEPVGSFSEQIGEAFATIPDNLADLAGSFADPLGIGIGDLSDQSLAAADQEVEVSTLTLMGELFDGQWGAFSYLLFVLLYMPCVATIGALYKEAGPFWAFFSTSWNTLLAYSLAVICYQSGQLQAHPQSAGLWITAMLASLVVGAIALLQLGKQQAKNSNLIPAVNIS